MTGIKKQLDKIKNLSQVALLLLDVDGVLTDGKVIYDDSKVQTKAFDVKDGLGMRLLMDAGVPVGIITGRASEALAHRCKNLGISLLHQGVKDKAAVLAAILEKTGISAEQTAYVGDDLADLPVLTRVGFPIAVADAVPEVAAHANAVTLASGGKGAVREVCEAILKARGVWPEIINRFCR